MARVLVHGLDVLGLAAVGLLGAMLAGGLTGRPDAEFLGVRVPLESSENYLLVTGSIAIFFVVKSILATGLLRVTTVFLARVEAKSATEVARYLFTGDLSRLRLMSRGEIQWAVSSSSQIAFSGMLFAGSALVTEAALFAFVFAGFLFVDISASLAITVYFLLLVLAFQLAITRRLRRLGLRLAENAVRVNDSVLDMANAFREVTVLEKRDVFLKRFESARAQLSQDQGLQRFVGGLPRFFVEAALMLGIMSLILWQFVGGNLSEGLVVTGVFLAGGLRMMAALLPLQGAINDIRINGPQALRAHDLIRQSRDGLPHEAFAPSAQTVVPEVRSNSGLAVDLQAVSFSYPDSAAPALKDVNMKVHPGQFAAFVGPSGAGKTTLADLILGIHLPQQGAVSLDGYSPHIVRHAHPGLISYVPQKPGMVSGTIAANVALGIREEEIDRNRVAEALEMAGLAQSVRAFPDGIDTSLGHHADALSGGQVQRLGIARALYSKPRLMILDEATSALDAETEDGVTQAIETLRGHTTTIVIAHRLSTIQHADIVFVVDEGRLVTQGPFSTVRKQVPLIERYVQLMTIKDDPQ